MAKQLTAPGCIYTIVARVDTTIYSPDQTWVLDVPAGQHDFIAETNEIIIPADAMMRRKTRQHAKDRNRINLLGVGSGSLAGFVTRAIERIVGKGNVTVTYEDGKMTVVLAQNVTYAQVAMVENLLERMLPKDVVEEISDAPMGYTRLYFLESTGQQWINSKVTIDNDSEVSCTFESRAKEYTAHEAIFGTRTDYRNGITLFYPGHTEDLGILVFTRAVYVPAEFGKKTSAKLSKTELTCGDARYDNAGAITGEVTNMLLFCVNTYGTGQIIGRSYFAKARIYSFSISRNSRLQCDFVPTLDPAGKPCMFDAVTRKPFYNAASTGSDFIAGMTTDQALNLENLPITEDDALTVSLPWEDQWDAGVQNALDTASTKGWFITVQYRDPDVGAENIPISFLESTGTQYIDTGITLSNESRVICEFSNITTIDGMLFGARQAVGSNAFCATASKCWAYYGNDYEFIARNVTEGKLDANKNKWTLNNQVGTLEEMSFETPASALLFTIQTPDGVDRRYLQGRVYAFSIARNNRSQLNFIPALDRTGRPCMFDAVTGQLFYNAATTGPDFIAGMTWEQVRKLHLPTTGGQLTLSLPYEASIDGIAQTALDQARANGWELTLRYDEAEVPEGYSKLDFLESTGVQWIDTGIKLSNESEVRCEFENTKESQFIGLFGARISAAEGGFTCYSQYNGNIFSVKKSVGIATSVSLLLNNKLIYENTQQHVKIGSILTSWKKVETFETEQTCYLFSINNSNINMYNHIGRVYTFNISRNNSLQLAYIPCLDQEGIPCMYDLVSHQSFRNKGTGQFIAGMTWEQVRGLHLPAPGGKLTLSLPYEASIDSLAQTALDQARANGWELTLQYGDIELPAGYSELDFLESTGTQYMSIPFENNGAVTTTLEMQWTDIAGRQLLGYNGNALYFGVNAQKEDGWDSPGIWNSYSPLDRHQFEFSVNTEGTYGYVYLDGGNALPRANDTQIPPETFYLWCLTGGSFKCSARIFFCHIVTDAGLVRNLVPCLDPDGKPCLYDTVAQQPFRNNGSGQFTAGMTLEQVRALRLPAGGGQLTLSLPYEASLDGLAQTALDQARANGWVLTLQYDEPVVPAGYSKVDFLESTGTQYIDTGIKLSSESEVACDFLFPAYMQYGALFGARNIALGDGTFVNAFEMFANVSDAARFDFAQTAYRLSEIELSKFYSMLAKKDRVTINDYERTIADSGVFEGEYTCFVFGVNSGGRLMSDSSRIYTFSIASGKLQLAYIPCLDPEGVPCMYDLVSGQAFRNTGTGQFVVGMTMKQALGLANLPAPTTSNTMTISLPKEASLVLYNQEVEAALSAAAEKGWDIAVQYRDEFEDEAILNKYAECTTVAEMEAVNPDYKNDLTSDGVWVYPISAFRDANNLFRGAVNMKGFDIDISHLTNIDAMFALTGLEGDVVLEHPTITEVRNTLAGENAYAVYSKVRLNLPEATNISAICYHNYNLREVSGNLDKVKTADNAFFGRYGADIYSILDFKTPLPALSSGSGMFNRQGLTKESVLLICNSIPSYTSGSHLLMLGIHKDYKTDPEVNLALKKIDINYEPTVELTEEVTTGKGWTLTVQWNGMANGTTASTFDRGTIIYAKIGEIEHPDGTTEQFLDWGHYVTNWEERGYEQFRSLESAYEYFGLEQETNEQSNTEQQ